MEIFWTNGEVRTEGPRKHELSWSFLQQIHFDHNTSSPPKKYQQTWECSGFHTCKHNRVNQHAWRLHTLGDEEMFPESGVPPGTRDPENLVQKIQTVILDTVELTVPKLKPQIVAIFVVFGHLSLHLGWNNMNIYFFKHVKKTTDLLKFCFTNPLIPAYIWA